MDKLTLKDALQKLKNEGFPIGYPTLYQWASRGIILGDAPVKIAHQIGSIWYIPTDKFEEVMNGLKTHTSIRIQARVQKTVNRETRGRKPGTKFGNYGRRRVVDADRL